MTMFGKKHSKETIKKMKEAARKNWKNSSIRRQITSSNIQSWKNPNLKEKHKKSLLKSWDNKTRREKASKQRKELWKNPAYRTKMVKHNHWNWKGGKMKHEKGYIYILYPSHPFCEHHGYVREHRLIVEKHLNRYLLPTEKVHHINKIKIDNSSKNLMAFVNNSAHKRFENGHKLKDEEIIFDGRQLHLSPYRK